MTKEEKIKLVGELKENFKKNAHFYITDSTGMSVADINKFRAVCYKENVFYKVYKNTIIKKALEQNDVDYTTFGDALKGTSGIMFVKESGTIPARLLKKFKKEDEFNRPIFKAASIDSDIYLGENNLETLCNLKTKEQLVGEIIGMLQSPFQNVLSSVQSGKHKLAGIVKTLSERTQ